MNEDGGGIKVDVKRRGGERGVGQNLKNWSELNEIRVNWISESKTSLKH